MTRKKDLTPDDCFHPDTKVEGGAVAFYSVEGSPLAPIYEAVILGRTKGGQPRTVGFRAASALGLVNQMSEAGWNTDSPEEVARLCESAGRSQKIVRDRQFISEKSA
jgi:hypothetical protein